MPTAGWFRVNRWPRSRSSTTIGPQYYAPGGDAERAFARSVVAACHSLEGKSVGPWTLTSTSKAPVGVWDARAAGLGGWDLSGHHAYDPNTRTLLLGDGSDRSGASAVNIITRPVGHRRIRVQR